MVYLEKEKWLKIKEKIWFFSEEKIGKVVNGIIGQFLFQFLPFLLGLVLGFLFSVDYIRIRPNFNNDDDISLMIKNYLDRRIDISIFDPYIYNLSSWQKLVNKIGIAWYLFPDIYEEASKNEKLLEKVNLTVAECEKLNLQYSAKREQTFSRFIASLLLEERQTGNIPAWEGIRIVRERI
jgi:hypothetical protein